MLMHPEKASFPIEVKVFGKLTSLMEEQRSKAFSPIVVTPLGILTDVSDLHPKHILSGKEVRLLEKLISSKALQPIKACTPIETMLSGIVIFFMLLQGPKE